MKRKLIFIFIWLVGGLYSSEVIVFLGPVGSGKSTQAKSLSKELNIPSISPGKILREEIEKGSSIGKICEKLVKKGEYVPNEMIFSLIEKRISEQDCQKGYILDGFPRTKELMEMLHKLIKKIPEFVFYLSVSEETSIDRCSKRAICPNCGIIVCKENICYKCCKKLMKRGDDTKEIIAHRLNLFRQNVLPVIKNYQNLGVLHVVDGEKPQEKIKKEIFHEYNRENFKDFSKRIKNRNSHVRWWE